jgi:hypothetical protein
MIKTLMMVIREDITRGVTPRPLTLHHVRDVVGQSVCVDRRLTSHPF